MPDLMALARERRLPPLIRIDRAECPEHGPVLPEAFALPFSLRGELLTVLPLVCYGCLERGAEYALTYPPEIDWLPVDAPLTQHWADIGHDPDATPPYYPVWEVRPVERGEDSVTYRTGSRRRDEDPD